MVDTGAADEGGCECLDDDEWLEGAEETLDDGTLGDEED